MPDQLIHRILIHGIRCQIAILGIPLQKHLTLQISGNALAIV
jgi:hypothetical protein